MGLIGRKIKQPKYSMRKNMSSQCVQKNVGTDYEDMW